MKIKTLNRFIDIINKWVNDKHEREFCINYLETEISKVKYSRAYQRLWLKKK